MVDIIEETENYLVGSPIYSFEVKNRKGASEDLKEYKGKVLLIVNSATGCGFTPQYEALEKLYRDHKEEGFEILDFPCDQFGHQAPGSNEEIHNFCTARYDISFPQFGKIEVNGENESELYAYLKSKQDFKGFLRNSQTGIYIERLVKEADPDYQNNSNIKWNFTKFLINRKGQVIDRFEPDAGTEIVLQAVEKALRED
ncbi:MAG: redoxin domain-containing protein [Lachnospiraceae bacterium]|nr:redoxin domain-containing protein [Lachnospiraceae bacterium]